MLRSPVQLLRETLEGSTPTKAKQDEMMTAMTESFRNDKNDHDSSTAVTAVRLSLLHGHSSYTRFVWVCHVCS